MNSDARQVHNKLDILVRNVKIKAYHDVLVEQGKTHIESIRILSDKTYKTWEGEKYFLGEKAITAIISKKEE
jgi:hypothetical protein